MWWKLKLSWKNLGKDAIEKYLGYNVSGNHVWLRLILPTALDTSQRFLYVKHNLSNSTRDPNWENVQQWNIPLKELGK